MKSILLTGVLVSMLAVASGCSGSDSGDDGPVPAGGINGPAIVDRDVEIGPAEGSDG